PAARFRARETFVTAQTDDRRLAIQQNFQARCFDAALDPNVHLGKADAIRLWTETGERSPIAKKILRLALPGVRVFEEYRTDAPFRCGGVFASKEGLPA